MAKTKSAALQRLMERNFGESSKDSNQIPNKKSKAQKRALQKRREEIRKHKESLLATKSTKSKKPKPVKNSEIDNEIQALREDIAKDIDTKATYVKRQYRADVPAGWEGLTPGLAPVGYNPDESDSDEDPY